MGDWEKFGSLPGWATFFMLLAWVIRTWPHWKAKVNEARKIELDAQGQLRTSLFERIATLEKAAVERDAASAIERRLCEEEIRALRNKLDGVVRQFIYFQLATARAIPPAQRTPEIEHMLEQWATIISAEEELRSE